MSHSLDYLDEREPATVFSKRFSLSDVLYWRFGKTCLAWELFDATERSAPAAFHGVCEAALTVDGQDLVVTFTL